MRIEILFQNDEGDEFITILPNAKKDQIQDIIDSLEELKDAIDLRNQKHEPITATS